MSGGVVSGRKKRDEGVEIKTEKRWRRKEGKKEK
jgi:hypothetical protein